VEIVAEPHDPGDTAYHLVDRQFRGIAFHESGQMHHPLVYRDLDRAPAVGRLDVQLRSDVTVDLGVTLRVRHGAVYPSGFAPS
jgi:hypothetical protein